MFFMVERKSRGQGFAPPSSASSKGRYDYMPYAYMPMLVTWNSARGRGKRYMALVKVPSQPHHWKDLTHHGYD